MDKKLLCQMIKVSKYFFISILISSQTMTNSLLVCEQARKFLLGNVFLLFLIRSIVHGLKHNAQ